MKLISFFVLTRTLSPQAREVFIRHLLLLCGISLLVVLIGWHYGVGIVLWLTGFWVGWVVFELDLLLDWVWLRPEQGRLSTIIHLWREKNMRELLHLLFVPARVDNLLFHSVVFEALLLVMSVYVVYSSPRLFPVGLVLGLLARCVYDQVRTYYSTHSLNSWFWQLDMKIPDSVQGLVVVGGVLACLGLTLVSL